jgi:transcriptional regulator
MYQPTHHREDRLEVQHDFIESHPLGLLISSGPKGLLANALPFLLQRKSGSLGALQVHMARANIQWKDIDDQRVLVVFQGPQAYVSPTFYATKRETGKVVPTLNYATVQARGVARVHTDTAWLKAQIKALTLRHEGNRTPSWAVSDAPQAYIESQLRGIVGVEIEIDAIESKLKVSQNRPEADRRGVVQGLPHDEPAVSELVRRYGKI